MRFLLSQNNQWYFICTSTVTYIVNVVKEIIKQDPQNQKNLRQFYTKTKIFGSFSFSHCIEDWNNLGEELRKFELTIQFKTKILSFIRCKENSVFKIHDTNRYELLNHFRFYFAHLNEHNFLHKFRATINSICCSGLETKTAFHCLLCCNLYCDLRIDLLNDIFVLNPTLKNLPHEKLLNILRYGLKDFSFNTNRSVSLALSLDFLYSEEHWMNKFLLKIVYMCVCSTWMRAYYDLSQCLVQHHVKFLLFCIILAWFFWHFYVDVCLGNLNQRYRKKGTWSIFLNLLTLLKVPTVRLKRSMGLEVLSVASILLFMLTRDLCMDQLNFSKAWIIIEF